MGDTKTPPPLKMERGQTLFFFKINSYLVAYRWKGRFNTKVMTLRKGFYDILAKIPAFLDRDGE